MSTATDIAAALGGWSPDPKTWDPYFAEAAKKHAVPERILRALIMQESSNNVNAYGEEVPGQGRAEGLGQFMPKTSAAAGISPWNPKEVIPEVARMLRSGYDKGKSWDYALKTYFGGPSETAWGPKTAAYPGQVAKRYKDFGWDPTEVGLTLTSAEASPPAQSAAPPPPAGSTMPANLPSIQDQIVAALSASMQPQVGAQPPPKFNLPAPSDRDWGGAKAALNGATLGYLPEISAGIDALRGVAPYDKALEAERSARTDYNIQNPLGSMIAELAGTIPPTIVGLGMADKAARMIPAAAGAMGMPGLANGLSAIGDFIGGSLGAGSKASIAPYVATRMASRAAQGAVQGTMTGGMLSHLGEGTVPEQMGTGALIGALANPVLGIPGVMLERALNPKLTQPLTDLLDTQAARDVGLRPGQVAQGQAAKTLENFMSNPMNTAQAEKFSEQFAKKTNLPNADITSENIALGLKINGQKMGDALNQIGSVDRRAPIETSYGPWRIKAPNVFKALDQLTDHVQAMTYTENTHLMAPAARAIRDVATDLRAGFTGDEYQQVTGYMGKIWKLQQSPDLEVRAVGNLLKNVLDEAIEHTVRAKGQPFLLQEVKQAKSAYRVLKAVEDLPKKTGNFSGTLDPGKLSSAVLGAFDSPESLGYLGDLAKVGMYLPKITQAGDTARPMGLFNYRNLTHYLPRLVTGIAAGAGGAHALGAEGALPYLAAAGIGAGGLHMGESAITRALSNPRYRNAVIEMNRGGAPAFTVPNASAGLGTSLIENMYGLPGRLPPEGKSK